MTITKFSVLILLLSIFLACNQTSKQSDNFKKIDISKNITTTSTSSAMQADSVTNDSTLEQKIVDTILKLPEVKERAKYIEQQTKGNRHLSIWIEDTPHLPNQNYYWIKAGEDNGTNLVTHFNFYVYSGSMNIVYYDTVSDSTFTLDSWRKMKNM